MWSIPIKIIIAPPTMVVVIWCIPVIIPVPIPTVHPRVMSIPAVIRIVVGWIEVQRIAIIIYEPIIYTAIIPQIPIQATGEQSVR